MIYYFSDHTFPMNGVPIDMLFPDTLHYILFFRSHVSNEWCAHRYAVSRHFTLYIILQITRFQ